MRGKRIGYVILLSVISSLIVLGDLDLAMALSDADYNKMIDESPDFAYADQSLNKVWARLTKEKKKALLESQRAWLKQRDTRAGKVSADEGTPLAEAYAVITRERVAALKAIVALRGEPEGIAGIYYSGMGYLTVNTVPDEKIEFSLTTDWPPQNCSGEIEKAVVKKEGNQAVFSDAECPRLTLVFTTDAVEISEGSEPCGYHGMNCNFEGTYLRVDDPYSFSP